MRKYFHYSRVSGLQRCFALPVILLLVAISLQLVTSFSARSQSRPSTAPVGDHPTDVFAPPMGIQLLTTGPHTSLRGLSAVNDKIVWVSGSAGTVGRTFDGGATWTWSTVPGYEK